MKGMDNILTEFIEFAGSNVADRPEGQIAFGPLTAIVTLDVVRPGVGLRAAQSLGDKQIDDVLVALIDHGSRRLALDVIQPAADELKILGCEIDDRWCDVQPAVEPWLHCVPVAGCHVDQMAGLQRAYMGRYDLVGDCQLLLRGEDGKSETGRQRRGSDGACCKSAKEMPPGMAGGLSGRA